MSKNRIKLCDRCGKQIPVKKVFYRYPAVKDKPSNTCLNIVYSKIITLCHKCVVIFDKNEQAIPKNRLIEFYEQYGRHNHNG